MLTRRTVILAKKETSYGVDAVPTASANALLVKDVSLKPTGETLTRDYVRDNLSPLAFARGMRLVDLSFKTELKGTGVKGALPAWGWDGVLFQACGCSETVTEDTSIVYAPVSTSFASATVYAYLDGLLQKISGCRGTFKINLQVGKYGEVEWSMKGLYDPFSDTALPSATFSTVVPPVCLSAGLSVGGYAPVAEKLEMDINNTITQRNSINSATGILEMAITGRSPQGSFDPEATVEATHAFWEKWKSAESMPLSISIGSVAGNTIALAAPAIQYKDLAFADRNGTVIYNTPFGMAGDEGDDEFSLTFI